LSTLTLVQLNVRPSNLFPPTFNNTSSLYNANVNQGLRIGSQLIVVMATDQDTALGSYGGGQVTYEISAGNHGSVWSIDPHTGNLSDWSHYRKWF